MLFHTFQVTGNGVGKHLLRFLQGFPVRDASGQRGNRCGVSSFRFGLEQRLEFLHQFSIALSRVSSSWRRENLKLIMDDSVILVDLFVNSTKILR